MVKTKAPATQKQPAEANPAGRDFRNEIERRRILFLNVEDALFATVRGEDVPDATLLFQAVGWDRSRVTGETERIRRVQALLDTGVTVSTRDAAKEMFLKTANHAKAERDRIAAEIAALNAEAEDLNVGVEEASKGYEYECSVIDRLGLDANLPGFVVEEFHRRTCVTQNGENNRRIAAIKAEIEMVQSLPVSWENTAHDRSRFESTAISHAQSMQKQYPGLLTVVRSDNVTTATINRDAWIEYAEKRKAGLDGLRAELRTLTEAVSEERQLHEQLRNYYLKVD